ncbi:chitin synthase chs-2 [Nephila pilipes]|uniref:chitin synthase n=1 Tax=Nephila pilipes TaxID=299642 RepID=A0A8X6UQH4_NEPPI|nr:chitin synthase chs-2 [Nephila pilipes]
MASAGETVAVNRPLEDDEVSRNQDEAASDRESEVTIEDEGRSWELYDESAEEHDSLADNRPTFTKAIKLLKIIVYLVTFSIVLVCAIVSKGTLLLLTSVVDRSRTFRPCNITGFDRDERYAVQLSREERHSWIWCLLLVFVVPELLSFYRSARLCIFKQYQKPKISSFITVFVVESLHVVGLVILVFVVFPRIDSTIALSLTNVVCILPSLLNVFTGWNSQSGIKAWINNGLNLFALMAQASIFIWIAVKPDFNLSIQIFTLIGVILVSFAWWENFVGSNSPKCLNSMREDIDNSRHFIYIFISIWKMILIFNSFLIYLFFTNENIKMFLVGLPESFKKHNLSVTWPEIDGHNIPSTLQPPRTLHLMDESTQVFLPLIVAGIHVLASFVCYSCGKFVCKICIQGFSYALPVLLTVPSTMILLDVACKNECVFKRMVTKHHFWKCPDHQSDFFAEGTGYFWILWLVSQVWITIHLWSPQSERMAATSKLFVNPLYCTILIDQSLALNRRRNEKIDSETHSRLENDETEIQVEDVPRIFACATMWHETPDEMEQLLKSIMRMDVHQCSQKTIQDGLEIRNPDYYEIEAHIFFDDAFVVSDENDDKMTINNFVRDLIEAVDTAASKVYKKCKKPDPPLKVPTPYGGRLVWHLRGNNVLVVHLKNKELIRHKKRWSQVMYMYYLLGYRLESSKAFGNHSSNLLKNTFILALDGDIDFKPNAVQLLVDLMNRNKSLGAACGRIHPVGTGLMVYYQKFEYAIGHWLQKATEHMIGCVLCSPGCFSLFRAEALMKKNTIIRYASQSKEAIEYVQFDQGEDRWLCTLLLQRGYRVEYSAASDAYTHCPETFSEFYTQRRRWAPSTMANIMDLLINYKETVKCNDNISRPYIGYQVLLMMGTILGPGTIFLMLVGAMVSAFGISNWHSFIANLVPIIFFILICFYAKNDTQIFVAEIFSALYALLMMAVLVGISLQVVLDGITSPSAIFILSMTASFIIAALAHPQEFWCVAHGLVYFLSVPSMYLLLALYSFTNLHVVSWGTREVQTKKTKKQLEAEKLQAQVTVAQQTSKKGGMLDWMHTLGNPSEEEGSISFGLANLFRCMCCTYPKPDPSTLHMVKIESHLKDFSNYMQNIQKQLDSTNNRAPGFRRRSSLHLQRKDTNLSAVPENEDLVEVESSDEEYIDEPDETTYSQPDNEYWLGDASLRKSSIKRLSDEEKVFWNQLIDDYLYPLTDNPEEKAKVSRQLLELRNKVVFGVLMLNSLFILIVFLLQMQKETLHIDWPLGGKANITYVAMLDEIKIQMTFLELEPINLVLVFFFTLILIIQFVAMLFHRFETLSHILASTNLINSNDKDADQINFSLLTDLLQNQGLRDDDEEREVDEGIPEHSKLNTLVKENIDGLIPNGFGDSGSLMSYRMRDKPKFGSLSVAQEIDLQKILDLNPILGSKVRRMSKNPEALDALKRRTSMINIGSNKRTPTPLSEMTAGIAMLDNAFGTPLSSRHLFYNRSFDTESVGSSQTVDLPTVQPTSVARSSRLNKESFPILSASLRRKLEKIKEDADVKENGDPIV